MSKPKRLKLALIRVNGGTQPRAELSQEVQDEYAELMREGVEFPPIVVFFDGTDYWLADGFHRYWAACDVGREWLQADIRQGTQRDAILYSVGANATHGFRRTNADKHRAVERMLADAEWVAWSDREIARRCAVSDWLVREMRDATCVNTQIDTPTDEPGAGTTAEFPQLNDHAVTTTGETPQLPPDDDPPPEPRRKVARGGTTYEQKVSSDKRKAAKKPKAEPKQSAQDVVSVKEPDIAPSIDALLYPVTRDLWELFKGADEDGRGTILQALGQLVVDMTNFASNHPAVAA